MSTEIRWEIEGDSESGGTVSLDVFRGFLGQLSESLRATELDLSGRGAPRGAYMIATLSYSSPLTVGVDAVSGSSIASQTAAELRRRFKVISGGNRPESTSDSALRHYGRLYQREVETLRLCDEDGVTELPRDWRQRIHRMLTGTYRSATSFRGTLEGLDMKTGSARLDPLIGARSILCHVPRTQLLRARESLGEIADICGEARYHAGDDWPYRFTVKDIVPLPAQESLPTAEQILGSMPNLTNGRGAVDYLRELRNEED